MMGFFSWVCKGCGMELCEGEYVRIAGFKGVYDGYGRVQGLKGGEFDCDGSDHPAWHERCYQAATPEQRADDTPSRPAPDQGCGNARMQHMPPDRKVGHYEVVAYRTEEWKDRHGKAFVSMRTYNLTAPDYLRLDINDVDTTDGDFSDEDYEKARALPFDSEAKAVEEAGYITGFERVHVFACAVFTKPQGEFGELKDYPAGSYEVWGKEDKELVAKGRRLQNEYWKLCNAEKGE